MLLLFAGTVTHSFSMRYGADVWSSEYVVSRFLITSIADPRFLSRIRTFPSRIKGQKDSESRIRIKKCKYFYPTNCFWALGKINWDVPPRSRIFSIPDPVSRGLKSTGSRIRIRNTDLLLLLYLTRNIKGSIIALSKMLSFVQRQSRDGHERRHLSGHSGGSLSGGESSRPGGSYSGEPSRRTRRRSVPSCPSAIGWQRRRFFSRPAVSHTAFHQLSQSAGWFTLVQVPSLPTPKHTKFRW